MKMAGVIAILEDDPGRAKAMLRAIATRLPFLKAVVLDNAPDTIDWLARNIASVAVLCLDHDLGPDRERNGLRFDPGTGRDVVDYLATQKLSCPVVIHSSNSVGASGMVCALTDAGWSCARVIPCDDLSWVGSTWVDAVEATLTGGLRQP